MTDLADTISSFARDILVTHILEQDGEYRSHVRYIDSELTRLCAVVDKETAARIDELVCEQGAVGDLREYAGFRAGFQMAVELMR